MNAATAIVFQSPEKLSVCPVEISQPTSVDVVVDIAYSGISTGTERLLWSGEMPAFPGMGYPLVPGYESVGRIVSAGPLSGREVGETVFVPGANCYGDIKGLFGGASSRVVVLGGSTVPIDPDLGDKGVLIALAATAQHALAADHARPPDLIVGHGALGRLLARIAICRGDPPPVVWERNPDRTGGAHGYAVVNPDDDARHDYTCIYDVSGDPSLLDSLIARLAPGGEIVLAGFYAAPLSFAYPRAFMKEARLRIAAEWKPEDLSAVSGMIATGALSLDDIISQHQPATMAEAAYATAFQDPACVKMVLDWRECR